MSETEFVGSVLSSLPLDKLIASPLNAMIQAQIGASHQYAEFLMSVCVKDGEAVNVQFKYDEVLTDKEGNYTGNRERTMTLPLIAAISHPNMGIERGTVDFEITVHSATESHSTDSKSGSLSASVGWGPIKATVHGSLSHKSEQTRKTDTTAKYSVHTEVKRIDPPEGLMKVIDFMTQAALKPVVTGKVDSGELPSRKLLQMPNRKSHSKAAQ